MSTATIEHVLHEIRQLREEHAAGRLELKHLVEAFSNHTDRRIEGEIRVERLEEDVQQLQAKAHVHEPNGFAHMPDETE